MTSVQPSTSSPSEYVWVRRAYGEVGVINSSLTVLCYRPKARLKTYNGWAHLPLVWLASDGTVYLEDLSQPGKMKLLKAIAPLPYQDTDEEEEEERKPPHFTVTRGYYRVMGARVVKPYCNYAFVSLEELVPIGFQHYYPWFTTSI